MGGIIGACLAIGLKSEEITGLFEKFSNIFNWIKFSMEGHSLIKSERIEKIFINIFGEKKIKDVKIPIKIIATDISSGDIRVFDKNDDIYIKDALLATMAIPGVFEEKYLDGKIYADGFLVENLGVNQTEYNDILAVDVVGKNSFNPDMPDKFFKTQNIVDMLEKSIRLLMYNQTRTNIKNSDKNIYLVEPETKEYKTFQFHKYKEIKRKGLEVKLF